MSDQVETHYSQIFTDGTMHLQQQEDVRLSAHCDTWSGQGGDRVYFNQIDATVAQDVTNRAGKIDWTEQDHKRRMVTMTTKGVADTIDARDVRQMLSSPVNAYTQNMSFAINREIDDVIFAAFFATASTGQSGSGSAAFDASNFSFSEASATNFAVADLLTARRILLQNENMENTTTHTWNAALSAHQIDNLLRDSAIQSIDTNILRALYDGKVSHYGGFNLIHSERAPINGSNVRSVPFWVKKSMKCAMRMPPRGRIRTLEERWDTMGLTYMVDVGSTRMDEKGVVRCLADETS